MISPRRLRELGILGINRRNIDYTLRANPRRHYPVVDDKLRTKALCGTTGVSTGRVLGQAATYGGVDALLEVLAREPHFVLKPARGSMGNGILVVTGREDDLLCAPGGARLTVEDVRYHAQNIIAGMFALGGRPDVAFAEELLVVHPALASISTGGVPDIRIVTYRGVPAMAMVRLPTARSRGRANLHQGAVGAGVSLVDGTICHAMLAGRPIDVHPDTGTPLVGTQLPAFDACLHLGVRCVETIGLGYVGVDVVIDARYGPMLLEMNARPGLAIQMANRAGLLPRLHRIDALWSQGLSTDDRIALARRVAAGQ